MSNDTTTDSDAANITDTTDDTTDNEPAAGSEPDAAETLDPAAIADEAIDSWDLDPVILSMTAKGLEERIEKTERDIKAHPAWSYWGTALRLALPMLMGLLAKKRTGGQGDIA